MRKCDCIILLKSLSSIQSFQMNTHTFSFVFITRVSRFVLYQAGLAVFLLLTGCASPIGITKVTPEQSYQNATANPLSHAGKINNDTKAVLHRFNLLELYNQDPQQAILSLHQTALKDDRRDLLFALAEMSYAYGEMLPENTVDALTTIRAQDVFLQSAVYAYLYLLSEGKQSLPSPYDNRFREACELYNRALDHGFKRVNGDDLVLKGGVRKLTSGFLTIPLVTDELGWKPNDFEVYYPSDAYDVYGFTVRNRTPGLGLPIIGVTNKTSEAPNGGALPITAFLRINGNLRDLQDGRGSAILELYSAYDDSEVVVNGKQVPLQTDTTAALAYRLNDPELWNVGLKNFIYGAQVENHMLLVQPYQPGRIPVVLVHGTVSSPVAWAEMVNTLRNDPVLRKRYQFWFYEYTSNAPIVSSAAILRETLTKMVERLDPEHKDPAMSEMVIIGHSQGGLLTNLMAVDSGDRFWRVISNQSFESLDVDPLIKANMSKALFFKSLPFVKRVIYISTPHRGSFLTMDWVRNLSRRLMTLPIDLVKGGGAKFAQLSGQVKMPPGLNDKLPTSIDGMTPGNPMMKALVESPLAPGVIDNSIIAVLPSEDIETGNDGVVEYSSAHIDNVESEYIVRSGHSVQGHPLAIEEVRRILLKHLNQKF